jgi:hypothetical protein
LDDVTSLDTSRSLNDSGSSVSNLLRTNCTICFMFRLEFMKLQFVMHFQDPDLDFEALRWEPIFVDKSMLIRSIMKDKTRRILLTAPPRFGKTMANNMLEMFFEIVNDEQKLEKYKLFKDLKIYKCTEECTDNHDCESKRFFRQHCRLHPVISLDFAQLLATSPHLNP